MMSAISRSAIAIAAAAFTLLTLPAGSQAGVVTESQYPCEKGNQCTRLTFTASPGEANDITISRPVSLLGPAYRLHDSGAPVTINAPGCVAANANTVTCAALTYVVTTGDGNDRVSAPNDYEDIDLGPGNDTGDSGAIRGGPGNDVLRGSSVQGGPGDDVLTADSNPYGVGFVGGPGADTMTGGPGDDVLVASDVDPETGPEAPAADHIDGGAGRNTVSYAGRRRPVVVDLAAGGPQGSAGENDTITNVQSVEGGLRDDRLRGDGAVNKLYRERGKDRLAGRGGDDLLIGGSGRDTFAGGDGDDVFDAEGTTSNVPFADWPATGDAGTRAPDVAGEPVDCGGGNDLVLFFDDDLVGSTCEQLQAPGIARKLDPFPRLSGARMTLPLPCPPALRRGGRCRGTMTIKNLSGGTRGASSKKRFSLAPGGGKVRLRLPRRARFGVPLGTSLTLRIGVRYTGKKGGASINLPLRYRIKLP